MKDQLKEFAKILQQINTKQCLVQQKLKNIDIQSTI